MSEGAKSPAALRGQGGPVHACVYVCAGGGNHGSASGFRASGPHRSKKTCPLVEPSLAAAWPFCPCRPSIFFPLFSPLSLYFPQYPQLIFSSSDSLTSPCMASRRGLHPP